jgi:hypothetical protein
MICDGSAGEQLHLLTRTNTLNQLARLTMPKIMSVSLPAIGFGVC